MTFLGGRWAAMRGNRSRQADGQCRSGGWLLEPPGLREGDLAGSLGLARGPGAQGGRWTHRDNCACAQACPVRGHWLEERGGKNKNGWRWGRQTEMRTRPTKDLPWRVLEDVEKDLQEGGQKKADWGGLSSMEGVGPRPPPNRRRRRRRRRRPAFVACVPFVWENLPRCGQRLGDV